MYLRLWGEPGAHEPDDEEPFLRHLPPTIATLVLDEIWAPYNNLIEDLANVNILRSLRRLNLNDVTQTREEGSEVEEDGELVWRSARQKLEGRMAKLKELCEMREIELKWEA